MNSELFSNVGVKVVKWVVLGGLLLLFAVGVYFQDFSGLIELIKMLGLLVGYVGILFLVLVVPFNGSLKKVFGFDPLLRLSGLLPARPKKIFWIFGFGEFIMIVLFALMGLSELVSPSPTFRGQPVIPILGRIGGAGILFWCFLWSLDCYMKYKRANHLSQPTRCARGC